MSRLLIVTNDSGWHGAELERAFAARGWETTFASLRDCRLVVDGVGSGLELPGFDGALPDGVFVRGVPGGTLEEIVFALDVLHALRECGVPIYNDARVIERTVDKAMTSFLLQRAGVATPPTWTLTDPAVAERVLMREHGRGHAVVCKPLFGAMGQGLVLLRAGDGLPAPEAVNGVYYLQRHLETGAGWFDWRVLVVGGRAVAAMRREAEQWLTNVAQGGRCHPEPVGGELTVFAERAAAAVGAQYAGVDLLRDGTGQLWVLEVNGIPAWKGLQGVSDVDIAGALADGFLRAASPPGAQVVAT